MKKKEQVSACKRIGNSSVPPQPMITEHTTTNALDSEFHDPMIKINLKADGDGTEDGNNDI